MNVVVASNGCVRTANCLGVVCELQVIYL